MQQHRFQTLFLILALTLALAAGCGRGTKPTATPSPAAAEPTIAELAEQLDQLPIGDFFEITFRLLLRRSPETLTEAGIAASFGLRNDQLDDLSDAYLRETQQLEREVLALLQRYDRAALPPEQQLSYDVYHWYLDERVRRHPFAYHDYPLTHYLNSYQFDLDLLLTELHPLQNRPDAEDYISRLEGVDDQVAQLLEGLAIREELGVVPPRFVVEMARGDLLNHLGLRSPDPAAVQVENLRFYRHFAGALEGMAGLRNSERDELLQAAREALASSLVPAYFRLIDHLDHLQPNASDDAGVWKLPDGDAYYAYLLRRETSTELTPAEIHQLGLDEVARIEAEMRTALAELGYPAEGSLYQAMQRAIDDAGYYTVSSPAGKGEYIAAIEAMIAEAEAAVAPVFDLRPDWGVVVIGGPTGGYYVPGSADGSRPGSYHVATEGYPPPRYSAPTTAYHEAIPGHHFQIAIAQSLELPAFRAHTGYNAYAEGWAMYAERLAWELSLYQDDPYGNLGRLELELLRAVRLVVDTGIHALRWTRSEAKAYMEPLVGPRSYEVERYIVMPAQATGYKIGMLKMLELRRPGHGATGRPL